MPSATPVDVLAQRRHLILSGDIDGYADLFTPDGVIESSTGSRPTVILAPPLSPSD